MLTFFLSYGGGTCAITPRKTRNIIRLLRPTPIQTFRVGGCTLPRARAAPRPVEDVLHVTSRRVTNKLPLLKPYSTSTDGFSACVCRLCASACSCWTLRKPVCAVRADLRRELRAGPGAEMESRQFTSSVLTPQTLQDRMVGCVGAVTGVC